MIGAGLPQIAELAGQARLYSERLFRYPPIGALEENFARDALVNPANQEGVSYSEDAIREIFEVMQRYSYFLQQWGYYSWNVSEGPEITREDVIKATERSISTLDNDFFKVRCDQCMPAESRYLRDMAELGAGPHRSGDIADQLGIKVKSIGLTRPSLIEKGMICSPEHGENGFTVPLFDGFMKRAMT